MAAKSTTAKSKSGAPGVVRISGGQIKGRKLEVPDGLGVRPTTDRARETLFNVLTNRFRKPGGIAVLQEARVLDAFAGTGAMGIEAWSRGASWVAFVENNGAHMANLRANVAKAKLPASVVEAVRDTGTLQQPFDIIIADPPYEKGQELVQALLKQTALWHSETMLAWERVKGAYEPLKGWREIHTTTIGKTEFSFQVPENAAQW